MQRYAAEIYRLQQDSQFVALTELSEHANSSAQATARMVARMKKLNYLDHEKYRGVRLTTKGEKIAMPSLRRHRLVEVFLVKVMKYGWDEAHEISDSFALGQDPRFEFTKSAVTKFRESGLKVEFASFPGDHEWQVWRKSLHDFAQRVFK